jgi:hypothetical protein
LLESQRNPARFTIVLEHTHFDTIADVEHFRRMSDTAPGHVRDVEQAIDPAQVDEGSIIGDVLDHPLDQLPFF